MKRLNGFLLLLLLLQTIPLFVSGAERDRTGKKFIELGWDIPSTQFLRKNWQEMEKTTLFDGVIYRVQPEGKGSSEGLLSPDVWKKEDFAGCINDLKSCRFEQFTDNFIRVNFSPGNVEWDDDAGWRAVANKVGICSWIAKETGSRGLAPDFESYGKPLFEFSATGRFTWEQAKKLAFQRGEEFVRAAAKYQPNAVFLCLWMNSINFKAGISESPDIVLQKSHYALLPSFIDGMLSAAPSEMTFVDGCELGYYYNGVEEYQKAALNMLLWSGPAVRLVRPDLRKKYREQVECGFGFYLDMYSNPKESLYFRGPEKGETRMERLYINLNAALAAADQYVWIYGEKNRWWNIPPQQEGSSKPILHWEKALPGLSDIILKIKNPNLASFKKLKAAQSAGKIVNIIENGSFAEKDPNSPLPKGWTVWQIENTAPGIMDQDATVAGGSARARKVTNGCFLQRFSVKPGELFYVSAQVRTVGIGTPSITARWQNAEGKWAKESEDRTFYVKKSDVKGSFQRIEGFFTAPDGVANCLLLVSANGQLSEKDVIHFDDISVSRLPK